MAKNNKGKNKDIGYKKVFGSFAALGGAATVVTALALQPASHTINTQLPNLNHSLDISNVSRPTRLDDATYLETLLTSRNDGETIVVDGQTYHNVSSRSFTGIYDNSIPTTASTPLVVPQDEYHLTSQVGNTWTWDIIDPLHANMTPAQIDALYDAAVTVDGFDIEVDGVTYTWNATTTTFSIPAGTYYVSPNNLDHWHPIADKVVEAAPNGDMTTLITSGTNGDTHFIDGWTHIYVDVVLDDIYTIANPAPASTPANIPVEEYILSPSVTDTWLLASDWFFDHYDLEGAAQLYTSPHDTDFSTPGSWFFIDDLDPNVSKLSVDYVGGLPTITDTQKTITVDFQYVYDGIRSPIKQLTINYTNSYQEFELPNVQSTLAQAVSDIQAALDGDIASGANATDDWNTVMDALALQSILTGLGYNFPLNVSIQPGSVAWNGPEPGTDEYLNQIDFVLDYNSTYNGTVSDTGLANRHYSISKTQDDINDWTANDAPATLAFAGTPPSTFDEVDFANALVANAHADPTARPDIWFNIISYPVPNNNTKVVSLTYTVNSASYVSPTQTVSLEWADTVNEALIQTVTVGDITPSFSLTDQPVSGAVAQSNTNYSVGVAGVNVTNVSGYTWNESDNSKDHTVDIEVTIGTATRVITYDLNFAKALVDEDAQIAIADFDQISVAGNTRQTTVTLPSQLNPTTLNALGLKLQYSTDNTTQWTDAPSLSFLIPELNSLDEFGQNRLYLRVVASDSNAYVVTDDGEDYLKTSGGVNKVDALDVWFDTTLISTASILLTGSSNNITNFTEPTGVQYTIEYSLNGGLAPSAAQLANMHIGSANAWMSKTELRALFNGTVGNLWDEDARAFAIPSISIRLVAQTGYALSSENLVDIPLSNFGISEYIDISSIIANLDALLTLSGNNETPVSSNINSIMTTLANYGLEIFYTTDSSASYASSVNWGAANTLPARYDFFAANRHLSYKVLPIAGQPNFELSVQSKQDITTSSGVQNLQTLIDTSVVDLSLAKFSGNTNAFTIDESATGRNTIPDPTAVNILYRTTGPLALDSGWLETSAFITWLQANPSAYRSAIESKLEAVNANYIISSDQATSVLDISDFYSYVDISTQRAELNNIQIYGTAEVANGAAFSVASSLSNTNLASLGIKLQYTLDGTTWLDASIGSVSSDTVNGIPSITNGQLIHLERPNPGSDPIIRFRLTPFEDDLGNDISASVSSTDPYTDWIDASYVHTSEVNSTQYIAGTWDDSVVVVNMDSIANALPALVVSAPANLAGITIQGDSNNPILTETLTGGITTGQELGNQNPGKPDYDPFIKVAYSIIDINGRSLWLREDDFNAWLEGTLTNNAGTVYNGASPVLAYDTLGVELPLPVANINPDWNTIQPTSVEAKWVSIDTQYKVSDNSSVPINTTNFDRWTDIATLVTHSNAITATGGHSDAVTWSAITALIADATTLGLKVQFAVGSAQPSYGTGAWTDTIPTNVQFDHLSRKLWFQVIDDGNGHVVSDQIVYDLTATSLIADIDARVVTTSVDVTDIDFTGDGFNAVIEETRLNWTSVEDPSVVEIVYSSDGTNWRTSADFVAWLRTNPGIRVADIEAKVVVRAGAGNYIILPGEENIDFPDTTLFNTYKDITAESNALSNINIWGIAEKANSAAFTVPAGLTTTALNARGLMLQFTVDGTTWSAASLGSISPADGTGIPTHTDGQIITVTRPSAGDDPIIKFRIVPIANEDGVVGGTAIDTDAYTQFVDDNKMNLSDYVAAGYNAANIITSKDADAAALATEVVTDNTRLNELTIAGDTKSPTLTEQFTGGLDHAGYLATLNPNKPDYSANVKIAYSVIDINGRSYWMLQSDFVEYLRGDLVVNSTWVENTSGQRVEVWDDANNYIDLPTSDVAPDWNSIDIISFEAKWVSDDAQFLPNNTTTSPINFGGIVMWIDIAGLVAQAQADVQATGGDSGAVTWSDLTNLKAAATALGLKVEFSVANTMPTWASTASWTDDPSAVINFIHNTRNLWVKFLDDGTSGNVVSDEVTYDLTGTSNVQDILAWIDTSTLDPHLAQLSGNESLFDIDESSLGYSSIPIDTSVEAQYQVGTSGWLNANDFIAWFTNPANTNKPRTDIEVQLVSTDGSLYVVKSGEEKLTNPDITNLYSYIDISSEVTDVNNIQLYGTAEVPNGAAFSVASSLSDANLNAIGIKLQYTLDGVAWHNANIGTVAADLTNGIPSIPNGQLIYLERPSPGAAPIIRFRLTPFEDDLGNDITTSVANTDIFSDWVDASYVHTSQVDPTAYIAGTWDESVVVVNKDAQADVLPVLIVTDPSNLAGITIQGDSKNPIISETLTGPISPGQDLGAQNPGKPDYEPFIKIAYSIIDVNGRSLALRLDDFEAWLAGTLIDNGGVVENAGNPVLGYDANGAEQALPIANIYPDWNTIQPDTVEAQWVSIDPLYKANNNGRVRINSTVFERWTDITGLVTQANAVTATGGHSDIVVWSDITAMLTDAATLGLKVQFAVGSTQPSYGTSPEWQDTIPTNVQFDHASRKLWFQVIDNGNGHVVSDPTVHDLTATSLIADIDARVVTTSVDLTDVDFTIDPYNAVINEARLDWTSVEDPSVVEVVYTADGGTTWLIAADFVAWLRTNPETMVADIEAKIAVKAAAGAYIILPGEENQALPNTALFNSYKDISAEVAELPNIGIYGISDKTDAAAYTVPAALTTGVLSGRGLMLQYTVDGTTWTAALLGSISPANGAGIPTHSNGEIITVSRPSSTDAPIIRFRIVPIADEAGTSGAVPVDSDSYSLFVDGNKMNLSDYVAAGYNAANIVSDRDSDADLLATEVITDHSNLNELTIAGNTKAPTLTEQFTSGQDYAAYLASLNPNKPDYSANVKIAYSVIDINGRSYWMLQSDFVEYLRGDLVVNSTWVENTSGQRVEVWDDANNYIDLPTSDVAPDWNSIDITSFQAKWVSDDALYIPNNTTTSPINFGGIVMWIDIAGLVAQAQADVQATGGDSGAVTWSNLTNLKAAATALGLKVEFSVANTMPTWASTASWTDDPSAVINFIHNTRNLWVKFLDDGTSGNVVSDEVTYDLTGTSNVQDIIAYINTSTLDTTNALLTGNESAFDIDETGVGYSSIPIDTSVEVLYQVGTSGWLNRNDFIAWFTNPANTNKPRTQIESQLATTDGSLYVVRSGDENLASPDIIDLYSYVDITAERAELSNIQLFGTAEVADGAAFSVDASLSNTNLSVLGIKLQYTLDGINWLDATIGAVAANNTNGIPTIANGQLIHLTRPNPTSAPIIRFRLTPFEDDLGNDISGSVTNGNDFTEWIDASYVHTSEVNATEYIAGTWDASVVIENKDNDADALPALVITDPSNLAGITIQGDSKNPIISELLTGSITTGQDLDAQNPGKPDYDPFIKVAYSIIDVNGSSLALRQADFIAWLSGTFTDVGGVVHNGPSPVLGYDANGVEQPFPIANIYPDWNTIQPDTVEAQWVSIDPLYKANNNGRSLINTTAFERWTDITGLVTQANAVTATGGHSDLVVWSDITAMVADATTLGLKVQFAVGSAQPSYGTGTWTDTIPTDVQFDHASRKLWFQVIDDGNGHVVSDQIVYDLTATSLIADIDARVVTTSVDLTDVDFTIDPYNAVINEARLDWTSVEDPSVVEVVYTADGGTTWLIAADFVAWLRTNPETMVADIEAKIAVKAAAGAYIILPGEENQALPNTALFNSYKDISAEVAELPNIGIYGISDKTDAAAYTVPAALTTGVLSGRGLMLQYTVDGTTWTAALLGSISPADGAGIPTHANGEIITVSRPSSSAAPIIRFRIVPIADEAGTSGAVPVDSDSYSLFVDGNKMNLSDYVAAGYNAANIVSDRDSDADLLATEVATDHSDLYDLTISGNTKNPLLVEEFTGGLNYAAYLASLNLNKPDYSANVKLAYSVTDINGNSYWMLQSDFVEYLRGDLTVISTWVENTSGQRVQVWDDANNYIDLPTANVAPDWNSIDITSFEAKWVSDDALYIPSNATPASINSSNIVMWIDIAGLVTQAEADIRATGGDSDDVVWSSTAALEAAAAALGLQVQYSISDTMPGWATATSWTSSLSITANFIHNTRRVWVKFLDDGTSGNVVSDEVAYDLTSLSNIEDVLARIDTSTLSPNLSQLSGNETAFNIDETAIGYTSIPIGTSVEALYSVGTSGWLNAADFMVWFSNPANTNKARLQIEVQLASTDGTLYVIRTGEELLTSPDVTNLYSYNDVTVEAADLANIQLFGVLGKVDGVVYQVPTSLTEAALNARGLKLQYTLDNANWNDSSLSAPIAQDPVNGIGVIPANHGQAVTVPKPVAGNPVLSFRLVSVKDDEGNVNAPNDPNEYDDYVEANKVHLSDYVAAGYNSSNIEVSLSSQAANLPTLVITAGASNFLDQITIQGNSRDAQIGETFTVGGTPNQTWANVLASLNPNNDFSNVIRIAYAIDDGNGNVFYLESSNFERWLSANFTVSGSDVMDGSTVIWGWDSAGVEMQMPISKVRPDYNAFDYDTFQVQAKWVSNDTLFRPTDSTSTVVSFNNTSFQKWIDVQAYIDRLEVLSISGDTRNLVENEIVNILADITAEFGANHGIQIEVTRDIIGSTPDWTNAAIDSLPATMNLLYDLAFRITDNGNSKHVTSTEATVGTFDPHVVWDHSAANASTLILKFINVERDLLEQFVVMSGDTLNIVSSEPASVTNADDDGDMSSVGAFIGIDILYAIRNVTGINDNAMPLDLFQEYLSNQLYWQGGNPMRPSGAVVDPIYGFTALNINVVHDGTWGRDSIYLGYTALPGYIILPSEDGMNGVMDKQVLTTSVDRYIDITSLRDEASLNNGVVIVGDATRGWWNEVTGAYDDMKTWGGYVDSQDLRWDISTLLTSPGALHAEIEYSMDNGAWTKAPSVSTIDLQTARNLRIRFVNGTNYATGEAPVLSDYTEIDITTVSLLQQVETNINISNPALSNVELSGLTNGPTIIEAGATIPSNADIHYSLTDFKDANHADSLARLAQMGLDSAAKIAASGYHGSMTQAEFQTFINNNNSNPDFTQVIRSFISVRLAADPTYSIAPGDDSGSRAYADVDNLYTYKDESGSTSQFVYQSGGNPGDPGGIGLFGQKTTTNGVAVSLPNSLTLTALAARGLKIQYTLSSNDGISMSPTPTWIDATTSTLTGTGIPGVPSSIPNGFLITMTPQSGGNAFIGFRLVPIEDDLGNITTGDTPTWTVDQYFEDVKTKPQDHNGVDVQPVYAIDTSQIPTVVNTNSAWLNDIQFAGSTRYATIHETTNGFSGGSSIVDLVDTVNTDTSLKNSLDIWYALDKLDGAAIAGSGDLSDAVWLTLEDMEAYLNGDLEILGGRVVYKSNGIEVTALTNATTMRAEPDYLNLDIDQVWSKFISNNASYIPSDSIEVNLVSVAGTNDATSFRKWFDGELFKTSIGLSIATGDTNTYTIALDSSGTIDVAELARHGLHLEYSLSVAGPWTTTLPDFMAGTWQEQDDRYIYAQVVPSAPSASLDDSDRLIIEYFGVRYNRVVTDSVTNGVRDFLLYIDVAKIELAAIDVKGNQYKLDDGTGSESLGLDESVVHNGTEKYSKVEIQYLFDGVWYNKNDLIAEMTRIRSLAKDGSIVMPADFAHNNVSARWFVLDTTDAVIAPGQDAIEAAKADLLKDFINFWGIQTTIGTFVNGDADYDLLGSINAATMNWTPGGALGGSQLLTIGLTAQWTTNPAPSTDIDAPEWQDANTSTEILRDVLLDPNHRSLWVRFIPTDRATTDSSTFASLVGNDTNIQHISIDTSAMRYAVSVNSAEFTNMPVSGTTQSLLMDNSQYIGNPWLGVIMENVDASGNAVPVPDAEKPQWFTDVGLTTQVRVVATRTQGGYVAGDTYEFNDFIQFQNAINSKDLNFDRSTLEVSWGIVPQKAALFTVSDANWIRPTDADNLINIVYTEDITALHDETYLVTGNNLLLGLTQNDAALDPNALLALGVKIQYNIESSGNNPDPAGWTDIVPTALNEDKNFWIRFAPIDGNYQVGDDALFGDQTTKLRVVNVKVAIVLDTTWLTDLTNTELIGNTWDITWGSQWPAVPTSDDGGVYGRPEFTIETDNGAGGVVWGLDGYNFSDILFDQYGKALMLDKDRDPHVRMKYVIEPGLENLYEFTDATGGQHNLSILEKTVDISGLTQPVFTDWNDARIGNATWLQFANSPDFKALFTPGTSDLTASLEKIVYSGEDVQVDGVSSFYNLDVNIFDASDRQIRDAINALAPRNTTFEFRTRNSAAGSWGSWTSTMPTDVIRSTIYAGFEVRLVANTGYVLPDGTNGGDWLGSWGDQTWSREYNVVVEKNTEGIQANTAAYIGFDSLNGNPGTGRFETDDPTKDYNKGLPLISILAKDGSLHLDQWLPSSAYVLEYRVTDRFGTDIVWTDENNVTAAGWHEFATPPSASMDPFGYKPIDLSNGNVVYMRLRARNGYVIIDPNSDDPAQHDPNWNGYVSWSEATAFPMVSGLVQEIDKTIVDSQQFYDPNNLRDMSGGTITNDTSMPQITFSGNEDHGLVDITTGRTAISNQFDVEVMILEPYVPTGVAFQDAVDGNQNALLGYITRSTTGSPVFAYLTPLGLTYAGAGYVTGWQSGFDEVPGAWKDPSTINDLYVGAAILPRIVPKTGYGLRWEDPSNTFDDEAFPKYTSEFYYNRNTGLGGQGDVLDDFSPIPVRGLLLVPPTLPSDETLVYLTEDYQQINGNAGLEMSWEPETDDKWRWRYDIYRKTEGPNQLGQTSLPAALTGGLKNDLYNGDSIYVWLVPVNASYDVDPAYASLVSTKHELVISGLKDEISSVNVPRPSLTIDGYEGSAELSDITESTQGGVWVDYDRTGTGLPVPVLDPSTTALGGVKWEYQIFDGNPNNALSSEINTVPWSDQVPTNLIDGQWVRSRLAPIVATDIVYPAVYSQGTHEGVNASEHRLGWTPVTNLFVDTENLTPETRITGYDRKTTFAVIGSGSLEDNAVIWEASIDENTWYTQDKWAELPFSALSNGDNIFIRAKAESQFRFNPLDDGADNGNISITADPMDSARYIVRNTEWNNIEVDGLLNYLDVSSLSLTEPTVERDHRHPTADDIINNPDEFPSMHPDDDILNGFATISESMVNNFHTVEDVDGNKVDSTGKSYQDYLEIRYLLRRFDIDSGNLAPEVEWLPSTGTLGINDEVTIELYSNDENYALSRPIRRTIVITGLIQAPPENQASPVLSFAGESGAGTVNVTPAANSGFKWQYAVWETGEDEPDFATLVWSDTPPVDLENGWHVAVKLASTLGGIIVEDFNTGWVMVTGLRQRIDLSSVRVMGFDVLNPFNPVKIISEDNPFNVAFKVVGDQEGYAYLDINAPLQSDNIDEQLTDISGAAIPYAEYLQWEFAYSTASGSSIVSSYSYSLPRGLTNGMLIHARLAPKDGVVGIETYGFSTITIRIDMLQAEATVSNQLMVLLSIGAGGALAFTSLVSLGVVVKSRKKRMI